MRKWYEKLFENYAHQYDREVFTRGTSGECDFIEEEAQYNRAVKILDIGCGTGRHSIELTKRGYDVTGIDLSPAQLDRARQKAGKAGLDISFLNMDAGKMPFTEEFDLAVMLCEGGFPLMETDEKNFDILKCAAGSLRSPGKLIFTTLNGLFPVFNSINEFHGKGNDPGASYVSSTFDLMTFRDNNITTFTDDEGHTHSIECNERYYIPSEITWLLKSVGFLNIEIYGAKLGAFSREDKLDVNDYEMLVIAQK